MALSNIVGKTRPPSSQLVVFPKNKKSEMIPKRHTVSPVLVTTFGLDYNEYSGFFQNVVTMEDLFA